MEDFIDKQLKELIIEGSKVIEEVKKKEAAEQKLEARRPSIQERIASQSLLMMGAVDDWLDTWGSNPSKFDPKSFRISKHLNDVKCTQAHARKIKEWYTDEIAEFTEVLQPPSKAQRDIRHGPHLQRFSGCYANGRPKVCAGTREPMRDQTRDHDDRRSRRNRHVCAMARRVLCGRPSAGRVEQFSSTSG